jgi:polyisoprenoid-binding protein YceI
MQAQEAVRYQIDPAMSRFTIKVVAEGLFSSMGHNPTIAARDLSGEARFVPASLDQAFLRVTVRPDSFEVTGDVNQNDRADIEMKMKQEVLDVSRYPDIVFESSAISPTKMGDEEYLVKISGNLTVRGVTHTHAITCQVAVTAETIRGFGEFSVRQTDYGIKLVSVAGGLLKVKDEVRCSFDVMARRLA